MRQLDSTLLIRINRTDKDQVLKSFGTNNVSEYLRDKLYEYYEKSQEEKPHIYRLLSLVNYL